MMRVIALLLMCISMALAAFGLWGMFTEAGNRAFDEMAGMIPVFALEASLPVLVIALCLWYCGRSRVTKDYRNGLGLRSKK